MERNKKTTVRLWTLSGALLVLCALLTWLALDTYLGFTRPSAIVVEIGDYCGRRPEELALSDLFDVTISYCYDDGAIGTVVSQTPTAGSRRKLADATEKCPLHLTVSLGRERILLPDLIGQDAREAQETLRAWGLVVRVVTREGGTEGHVLSTSPRAGDEVVRGETVTLTVSGGIPVRTVRVPALEGLSRSEALVRAWMAGLRVDQVIEISADAPVGTVVRQSHRADTEVVEGTGITLYIAKEFFDYE